MKKPHDEKIRLDLLLVERGLIETRRQAQALILAGRIRVNGELEARSGKPVLRDSPVEVIEPFPYVGRGGIKLEHALRTFAIAPQGKICLDIGASTGGFTDCLLKKGAKKVYAVDVGKGQLAWSLRQDQRVVVLEKVNARYITVKEIPEQIDLCVMDVSFISVKKILPALKSVTASRGEFVVLVKPQFEAGREKVRRGIVLDANVHEEVLNEMISWSLENDFCVKGLTYSPIKGRDGNIEFFLHLCLQSPGKPVDVSAVVREAGTRVRSGKELRSQVEA